MICRDMIRRLSLFNQRGNDLIFMMQFPFGHVDPGSGIPELFAIFSVGKSCIIVVLVGDGTVSDFLAELS